MNLKVVDVHNHVIPERVAARLRQGGNPFGAFVEGDRVVHAEGAVYPFCREMWDPEAKLDALDAHGIDVAVVSPAPPLLAAHLPAETAAELCRVYNQGLSDFAGAAPERLRTMAMVPLQDTGLALAVLEQVDAPAIEVAAWSGGRPPGDPQLRPLWREVEARRLLVFVHPYSPLPQTGMERFFMHNLVGNPLETTLAMASIMLSGLLDDCPNLRFLLAHGGGFGPYQMGRWRHGYGAREDVRAVARQEPEAYLGNFYFDTMTHDDAALTYLIGRVGSERVLLGSDFPYDMADPDPVGRIDRQPLTAEARAAVRGGNAFRLLGQA